MMFRRSSRLTIVWIVRRMAIMMWRVMRRSVVAVWAPGRWLIVMRRRVSVAGYVATTATGHGACVGRMI